MERVTGIGPVTTAWEAVVLPLNYTRILLIILFLFAVGYRFDIQCVKVDAFYKVARLKTRIVKHYKVPKVYVCGNGRWNIHLFANLLHYSYELVQIGYMFVFE